MLRTLRLDGADFAVDAPPDALVLEVLRGSRDLPSLQCGCSDGSCGVCRVLWNGQLAATCMMKWQDLADGDVLETCESLESDRDCAAAMDRFDAQSPMRCRMCVGNVVVTQAYLRRQGTLNDREAIAKALGESTCWCTGPESLSMALMDPQKPSGA